jgi:hypothetical protein
MNITKYRVFFKAKMFHNINLPHSGQSTVLTFDPGIQNTGRNPRPEEPGVHFYFSVSTRGFASCNEAGGSVK